MEIVKRNDCVNLKKVLVVGETKSGKSTFVEKYCNNNKLKAVVLDFENTNYTDMDLILDFDLSNDVKLFRCLHKIVKSLSVSDYDTVVLDGIDSVIEGFISNANGLKAYADRSKTFARLINDLDNSGLNVIFVGQEPANLDYYKGTDENPNKSIIRLNARVNEVYVCSKNDKGEFNVECTSKRGVLND